MVAAALLISHWTEESAALCIHQLMEIAADSPRATGSSESEDYDDSISEDDEDFEERPSTSSVIIEDVTDLPVCSRPKAGLCLAPA